MRETDKTSIKWQKNENDEQQNERIEQKYRGDTDSDVVVRRFPYSHFESIIIILLLNGSSSFDSDLITTF